MYYVPCSVFRFLFVFHVKWKAKRFGAQVRFETVAAADLSARPFRLATDEGKAITADAVIVATGARAKLLDLPSERELMGYGVSACATCDGFFFKGKEIAVVGGGDTALEEATYLTRFASKVTVIHRRDELRASKIMQERALKNPKIAFLWDAIVDEIYGTADKAGVTGVRLRNVKTGALSDFKCDGVFMAIGHQSTPRSNPNIRFIACPFTGEELTVIPAHRPDVAIIHAQRADRHGNVWLTGILGVQRRRAVAAARSIVTVEEIVDGVDQSGGGTVIPHWAIDAVCAAPLGAFPSYTEGYYDRSNAFYQKLGGDQPGVRPFCEWMQRYVVSSDDFTHFLARLKDDGYV